MGAATAPAFLPSPLGRLERPERERVIALINESLDPTEAALALAALAGTVQEAWALPAPLQGRILRAILNTFPAGHAAIVVSRLGIARVGTESWLPAVRARYAGMDVAEIAREIERQLGHTDPAGRGPAEADRHRKASERNDPTGEPEQAT